MQELVNGFVKGLNKDDSKNKFPTDNLYHAENVRILTAEGLSNAAISNILGTIEVLDLNINANYTMVGWCNMQDDIILFFSHNSGSNDRVYRIRQVSENSYELVTNGIHTNYIYEGDLKLNSSDSKLICIGRYENELIQRIYFTDRGLFSTTNTMLRSMNVAVVNGVSVLYQNSAFISSLNFDIVRDVDLPTPKFYEYTAGNYYSGVVQYAYRYYNLNGIETRFSMCSEIIPLYSNTATHIEEIKGDDVNVFSGKGVKVTIGNLDTSYDRIEVVSLYFESASGTPLIRTIVKQPVSEYSLIVDTGDNFIGTIDLDVFTFIYNPISAATIETKDNTLFIGNIKESIFDVDIDARMYRFINTTDNINECRIQNRSNGHFILISGDKNTGIISQIKEYDVNAIELASYGTDIRNIPKEFDCINYNNNPINDFVPIFGEYQYQINATTLGGTGYLGNFEFTTEKYVIDGYTNDILSTFGSSNYVKLDYLHAKCYQRDEIYRFGLVCYDKYMRPSFVNWICDIRMPRLYESPAVIREGDDLQAVYLYPKFNIDTTKLPSEVKYIQIVQVKRTDSDKSIVGQGFGVSINHSYLNGNSWSATVHVGNMIAASTYYLKQNYIVDISSPEFVYNTNNEFYDVKIRYIGKSKNIENNTHHLTTNEWEHHMNLGDIEYDDNFKYYNVLFNKVCKIDEKITLPNDAICQGKTYYHYGEYSLINNFGKKGKSMFVEIDEQFTDIPSSNTDTALFNVVRNVTQYKGNTYLARTANTYIPASNVIPCNGTTSLTCKKGDTYIHIFCCHRILKDLGRLDYGHLGFNDNTDLQQEFKTLPVETTYNLLLNRGKDFLRSVYRKLTQAPDTTTFEQFRYTDFWWGNEDNLYKLNTAYKKMDDTYKFFPKPTDFTEIIHNNTLVKYSDVKINGEAIDAWLKFRPNNSNTVDGRCKQLNSIVEHKNQLFFFQEDGVSLGVINRRETISGVTGTPTILGTGNTLQAFEYISTLNGCQYTSDIIKSPIGLYWLDLKRTTLFRLADTLQPLSIDKNLHSYFLNTIDDNTSMNGMYDTAMKCVYLTIINKYDNALVYPTDLGANVWRLPFNVNTLTYSNTYKRTSLRINDIYVLDGYRLKIININPYYIDVYNLDDAIMPTSINIKEYLEFPNTYTISYNELLEIFDSFHSFIPKQYVGNNRNMLTSNNNGSKLFLHNKGNYNSYYNVVYPSKISLLNGIGENDAVEFCNFGWYTEATNDGQDVYDETFDYVQVENDYQQSDKIKLYPKKDLNYIVDTNNYQIEYPLYTSGTYHKDQIVFYNNKFYIASTTTTNVPTHSDWSEYKISNIRRNIREWDMQVPRALDMDEIPVVWTNRNYQKGDLVLYNNIKYSAKEDIYLSTDVRTWHYGEYRLNVGNGIIYQAVNVNDVLTWQTLSITEPSGNMYDNLLWKFNPMYNRMRDTYMKSTFTYNNSNNNRFIVHDIKTFITKTP